MKKAQVLGLLASAALSVVLTGCGATLKPDHPQVYDDFSERRAPKENISVENGSYPGLPRERVPRFTPYTGPVYDGNRPAQQPGANDKVDIKAPTQLGTPEARRAQEGQEAKPVVPSEEQRSVWERLRDKFSSRSTGAETQTLAVRKPPIENTVMLANIPSPYLEQGSTSGYSYYEMADEILDGAPVDHIIVTPMLLASNNASASLVDVPEPQSYTELKQEGGKLDKQNLKDVPQAPQKKSDQPTVKPKPAKTKPKQAASLPTTEVLAEAAECTIQDKSAKIIYTSGQPVLVGTMGVIRERVIY